MSNFFSFRVGFVIMTMIVETVLMKEKIVNINPVILMNFRAVTSNVSEISTDVTEKMTVVIIQMKLIAVSTYAILF